MARTVVGLFYGAPVSIDEVDFYEHQSSENINILYGYAPALLGYWCWPNLIDVAGDSLESLHARPEIAAAKTQWAAFVDRWVGSDHPAPVSPRLYIATQRE